MNQIIYVMKSKAAIKGHPIHPILVAFPVAFFTGTLIFDILGKVLDNPALWHTGFYLEIAGIIGGLAAAVPGIIDYFFTVPPESSAKKRATKHGLLNITTVAVFFIAWMIRHNNDASSLVIISLEVLGVILLSVAGWMGGTLVYRNQIAVNPRYAHAGKWNEEYIKESGGQIHVADSDELQTNQMKLIHVNHKRIVIAKTEEGYVAFNDRCTHKGGSLAGGSMICGTVQCPWHGSQFDVKTGMVKAGPAKERISTYEVSESAGKIYLAM